MIGRILAGVGIAAGAVAQAHGQELKAGSYEFLVCRTGCGEAETGRAYLTGTIVVLSEPFAPSEFPRDTWDRLAFSSRYMSLRSSSEPTGCFALSPREHVADSSAGIRPVGLLFVSNSADTLSFPLYRSPDAGYAVAVVLTTSGFRGIGHSWGAGAAAIDAPLDSIVGRYSGPVDLTPCITAARESLDGE